MRGSEISNDYSQGKGISGANHFGVGQMKKSIGKS
jgi:hypothetical protein